MWPQSYYSSGAIVKKTTTKKTQSVMAEELTEPFVNSCCHQKMTTLTFFVLNWWHARRRFQQDFHWRLHILQSGISKVNLITVFVHVQNLLTRWLLNCCLVKHCLLVESDVAVGIRWLCIFKIWTVSFWLCDEWWAFWSLLCTVSLEMSSWKHCLNLIKTIMYSL